MDAIALLKDDHKTVEALFKRFEKSGDNAHAAKRKIVDRIVEELSVHANIEERLFYPVTRRTVPEVEDLALESLEEHHIVKWVLSELDGMDPTDERFDPKVTVLIENVRHHVKEEEREYFPKVRDELGRKALNELGDALEIAKRQAPQHPHPRLPDVPPANVLAGAGAAVAEKVVGAASQLTSSGVDAAQEVVERVKAAMTKAPRKAAAAAKSATAETRTTARRTTRAKASSSRSKAPSRTKAASRSKPATRKKAAPARQRSSNGRAASSRSTSRSTSRSASRTRTPAKKAARRG